MNNYDAHKALQEAGERVRIQREARAQLLKAMRGLDRSVNSNPLLRTPGRLAYYAGCFLLLLEAIILRGGI